MNRDSGLGSIVLIVSIALDLPLNVLTARAARPPVDAAPAAIQATVAMHAGHIAWSFQVQERCKQPQISTDEHRSKSNFMEPQMNADERG